MKEMSDGKWQRISGTLHPPGRARARATVGILLRRKKSSEKKREILSMHERSLKQNFKRSNRLSPGTNLHSEYCTTTRKLIMHLDQNILHKNFVKIKVCDAKGGRGRKYQKSQLLLTGGCYDSTELNKGKEVTSRSTIYTLQRVHRCHLLITRKKKCRSTWQYATMDKDLHSSATSAHTHTHKSSDARR